VAIEQLAPTTRAMLIAAERFGAEQLVRTVESLPDLGFPDHIQPKLAIARPLFAR